MTKRGWSVAMALAATLFAGMAWAAGGTVSGTVTDPAGAAVSGCEVRIDGNAIHGQTNDAGHYELAGVSAGPHVVRALMLGFKPATHGVTVTDGGASTVDLSLERNVLPIT